MSHQSTVTREQKDFAFQVKEFDDETGTVKGYLSTFNNVDEQGDRVRPNAFKRTLQSKYEYKNKHHKSYLMPLLWQHDTGSPIGGYAEAKEDSIGLYVEFQVDMDVQRGREAYSGLKKGYIFQQSIGYDVINAEYVKDADGKMVRDLLELRLWEGSIVTFPANTEAVVTSVKSLEQKSVCGDTSLSIGPRDEHWHGTLAKKQIFAWAEDDEGHIDASKAKKCFLQVDGDVSLKGSYGYPFCNIVDGSPRVNVGGVKACASALDGSRGASTQGEDIAGMRRKVETLYKRINQKYQDDPELVPPWSGKEKASNKPLNTKTFAEHYNEEMAQDLLTDWQDVYVCALTCAIFDAFTVGDNPEAAVSQALDEFKTTVLAKFVAQALEVDLCEYLEQNAISYTPGLNSMQNGASGYMSNNHARSAKSGRSISAVNQTAIDDHVKSIKSMATKANKAMKVHVKAMHEAVDQMTGGMDDGDDEKSQEDFETKAGRALSATNAQNMHDMADKAMNIMQEHTKAVSNAADDFANTMQGAESPAYGDGEGEADDDQQEGRGKAQQNSSSYKRTPATQGRSQKQSTALENVEIPASWLDEIKLRKVV